eukprot:comp22912_c0_seq1/m.36250 comp22912_c0_seq1/g.36250  ORF comp22912_c0_seq1/g.36250 comp22912_c0_seq1/m.36250 type:complete len:350 (-) comp22912_c0_seq1:981-2030(-)
MALLQAHTLDDFGHSDEWPSTLDCFSDTLLDVDFSSTVNFDLPTPPASEACSPLNSPGPFPPYAENTSLFLHIDTINILKSEFGDVAPKTESESEEDLPLTPRSEQSNTTRMLSELKDIKTETKLESTFLPLCTELSLPPSPLLDLPTEGVELFGPEGIPPMQVFAPAQPQWPGSVLYAQEEDSDDDIDVVTVDPFPAALALKRPFTFLPTEPGPYMFPMAEPFLTQPNTPEPKRARTESNSSNATQNSVGGRKRKPAGSEEQQAKRDMHNTLERKRREDLKASFDALRWALPNLDPNDKQPKQVTVLDGAADHIRVLRERHRQLLEARHTIFMENQRLEELAAQMAKK